MTHADRHIKVSVIVTVYNQEDYIARTLDSILTQVVDFDYEVIVADDCSTDGTETICHEYAERYPDTVRYLRRDKNMGIVGNYYDAVMQACGEYQAECGGDDVWTDPYKLQKQADMLDADSDIVLVHTDWLYSDVSDGSLRPSDPQGLRAPYRKPLCDGMYMFLPLLRHEQGPLIHTCTMMIRRDALMRCVAEDKTMFMDPAWTCEDLQLLVAMCRQGKVAYMPEVTLHYTVGKPSLTSEHDAERTYNFYTGSMRLTRYLQQYYSVPDADMAGYYTRALRFVLGLAVKSGKKAYVDEVNSIYKEWHINLPLRSRVRLALAKITCRN